jgi:hypothetical protein
MATDLVRLPGALGWMMAADLTPCRACGGTRFRRNAATWGWACVRCLSGRGYPTDGPEMDVEQMRRILLDRR